MLKPKMRITKRNLETHMIEADRLVDQASALNDGAEEMEGYYVTLEVTIFDKVSAELAVNYIKQITGDLPSFLRKAPIKTTQKENGGLFMNDSYQKFIKELSSTKDQEALINNLRDLGYHFYSTDHLVELGFAISFADEKHEKYQWMVKRLKEAKDPVNDKLDKNLIIGIKIAGKHFEKVHFYYRNPQSAELFLKLHSTAKIAWPEQHHINFKKMKVTLRFPQYMTYDDRRRWRTEHEKLKRNPNYKPSKLYLKYKAEVEEI